MAIRAGADNLPGSTTAAVRISFHSPASMNVVTGPVGGGRLKARPHAFIPGVRVLLTGCASGDMPRISAKHMLLNNIIMTGIYQAGCPNLYTRISPAACAKCMPVRTAQEHAAYQPNSADEPAG